MAFCKTFKRTVHILIGIIIGFLVTSQTFRSLNYENFKRDILFQLCSYRNNNHNAVATETPGSSFSSNIMGDLSDLKHAYSVVRNLTDILDSEQPNKERQLLLIGVMTAKQFINTRALTIYQTWAQKMGGHLIFFSSSNSRSEDHNHQLPLVALPGVTDDYPPQKKSFLMLKFMHDFFGSQYDFFMRADDDVLVNVGAMKRFLRRLNSSRPLFLGQTGVGSEAEFGHLALHHRENFCMGGPGVVISRTTLAALASNTARCLGSLRSGHEDVELGRCVRQAAGVSCTWSYDMQALFYHNASLAETVLQASSVNEEEGPLFAMKELSSALTLHPIKDGRAMRRLYAYLQKVEHQEVRYQVTTAYRRLNAHLGCIFKSSSSSQLLSLLRLKDRSELEEFLERAQRLGGVEVRNGSVVLHSTSVSLNSDLDSDTSTWKFFAQKLYSELAVNPKRHLERHISAAYQANIRRMMRLFNAPLGAQRKKGAHLSSLLDYHSLYYGYVQFNSQVGVQYILDLLMIYRRFGGKRPLTIPIRRHAHAVQTFSEPIVREFPMEEFREKARTPSSAQKEGTLIDQRLVNVVVPLAGRLSTFRRFLANFAHIYKTDPYLTLSVVLFSGSVEHQSAEESNNTYLLKSTLFQMATQQLHLPPEVLRVLSMDAKTPFSRGVAFQRSLELFEGDQLLFFLDVDMHFTGDVLGRVRRNVIRRKQVYFPIVYSQYSNEASGSRMKPQSSLHSLEYQKDKTTITDLDGYWRQFGFGIVALYKEDLLSVGGYETSIRGWGMEDVALYDRFVSSPNVSVFRAVEPGLVHVYHHIHCDPRLTAVQYEMCLGTKLSSLDSTSELAAFIRLHHIL